MISDIIHISKMDDTSNDKALDLSRRVSLYKELSRKRMMHLRPLTTRIRRPDEVKAAVDFYNSYEMRPLSGAMDYDSLLARLMDAEY